MNQEKIKLAVQTAIQTLGAPVMAYVPSYANVERQIMIDKTVAILFKLLRDMEAPDERDI